MTDPTALVDHLNLDLTQPERADLIGALTEDPRIATFLAANPGQNLIDFAAVICTLHGHAAVERGCFGYWHCDRCGEQVGDSLAGSHTVPVIVGHDCADCRKAWAATDVWQRIGVRLEGGGFLQQTSAAKVVRDNHLRAGMEANKAAGRPLLEGLTEDA